MRKIFSLVFILILTTSLAQAREVSDMVGRVVDVPDNPQRIVALAPSITEIIFSLGQEAKLKGVTRYSDFPPAAKDLPRVGSYVHLDLERIVALQPDLCFATKDGNPIHIIEKIEALKIPVFVIDLRNMDEIMATIQRVGEVLSAQQKAAELVSDMRQRLKKVQRKIAQVGHRPAVFFQLDAAPIVSAGNGTFTNELINLAGGKNLAAGANPYPRYSWEEILKLQPEIVIVASMAGGYSKEKLKNDWLQWPQLPAVQTNRIYVVEANLFDRPTARLFYGLEVLAEIIHPELYERDSID